LVYTASSTAITHANRGLVRNCTFVARTLLVDSLILYPAKFVTIVFSHEEKAMFYTDPKDNFKVLAVLIVAYTLFVGVAYYLQTG